MKSLFSFFKSFGYAFAGVARTFLRERNMRVHVVLMIYMFSFLGFGKWFVLTKVQWCLLLVCCALVIGCELVNTAVESVVDLASPEIHPLAKIAKDAASGAVLVCAVFSVVVGVLILYQPEAFRAMNEYFKAHVPLAAVVVVSLVPAMGIIFGIRKK